MSQSAFVNKQLWDSLGNYCRVEMYYIGSGKFEVYFHDFNDATPRRFVGTIGDCNAKADHWIAVKKEAGFMEQLPSYNPHVWKP